MDQVKRIVGSLDSQPDDCLSYPGTTPPDRQAQLPPTPPATEERQRRRTCHASTGHEVNRMLRGYKRKAEESNFLPSAEFPVDPRQYEPKAIERLFSRHDYDAKHGILFVRMPSTIHEYFSSRIVDVLKDQLRDIRERGGKAGRFASKITSVGSARIFLKDGKEEDSKTLRRQPDAQFQHPDATYPGVVVEVSCSQDGKNVRRLAEDYILFSSGSIKAVIGIDINPIGKESTISLWRPKFTWLEGEEIDCLEAEQKISHMPFRRADGSSANQDECLTLDLSDFASDEVSKNHEAVLLSIEFGQLPGFLADAEQLQRKRESADGAKPRRPLKRMRLPSSSPEELRSDDEARFADKEKAAAKKADKGDVEFQLGRGKP